MNDIIFSTSEQRAAYSRVREFLRMNAGTDDFIINPNTLVLEEELKAGKSTYRFDLYQQSGADRKLAKKLNRNDVFFVTGIGLCIRKQDAVTGIYANYPLFTYPDSNYFVGDNAGANLKEYLALECMYNGLLTLKTSPVDRVSDVPTHNFRYVPERGYLIAAGNQVNDEFPQYGPDDRGRGLFSIHPNVILDGQENNEIILELGSGDTANIAGGIDGSNNPVDTTNVAVVLLQGFLIDNAAQKAGRWISAINAAL